MNNRFKCSKNTFTVFFVSILLAMSAKAMLGRNRESSSAQHRTRDRAVSGVMSRVLPLNSDRVIQRHSQDTPYVYLPEYLDGMTDSFSQLNIDSRPRSRSRFPHRMSSNDLTENRRLSISTSRDKNLANTGKNYENRRPSSVETSRGNNVASSSRGVREQLRETLKIPKLDFEKDGDSSPSEEEFSYPLTRSGTPSTSSTAEIEFKEVHGTSGAWDYAERLEREKRLHIFCTKVQLVSRGGFGPLVQDARVINGFLNLGSETIAAVIVRFTTVKKPSSPHYITKGLRADCVYTLSVRMSRTKIFTLGKHLCNIEGPSPVRASVKQRNLEKHSTALSLFPNLKKLFGIFDVNV